MRYRSYLVWPIGSTDELVHLQIAFLHNAPDLSVLARPHRHVQPNIGRQLSVDIHIQRTVCLPLYRHGRVHFLQFLRRDPAMYLHPIHPRQISYWVFEKAFECVIVGDQEQSFGVEIEPADGHEMSVAGEGRWQQLVDCFTLLRVAVRADVASRLVDHPQLSDGLLHLQTHWSECFQVGLHRHQHILENSLAVHPHQAQLDELLCFPARAQRLKTHPLGQPHHFHLLRSRYQLPEGLHPSPQELHGHNYNRLVNIIVELITRAVCRGLIWLALFSSSLKM